MRLARIGFDRVVGHLRDPMLVFVSRPDLVQRSSRLTADELARRMAEVPGLVVVDIRNPGERANGMIEGSISIPLPTLVSRLGQLDPD